MNSESSAAPITISGVAIGRMISRLVARRPKNSWRTSAIAISVPIAVETSIVSAASCRLLIIESFTASTANASFQ